MSVARDLCLSIQLLVYGGDRVRQLCCYHPIVFRLSPRNYTQPRLSTHISRSSSRTRNKHTEMRTRQTTPKTQKNLGRAPPHRDRSQPISTSSQLSSQRQRSLSMRRAQKICPTSPCQIFQPLLHRPMTTRLANKVLMLLDITPTWKISNRLNPTKNYSRELAVPPTRSSHKKKNNGPTI